MRKFLPSLLLLIVTLNVHAQQALLKKGMVISKSVKIKKGTFLIDGNTDLTKPVIIIEGNNITIDFNGAVLKGSNTKKTPDEFFGVAVMIRGGRNITIKNLHAKGYKVALMARNVDGLKIENCDLSYNYRQHLNSTQEREDISDWMSYHRNEKDEWLRYGAAIYLRGCNNAIISGNKVTQGQNALMITECNNGMIFNNDFSFNSAIGIGMYKSSNNKILHNKINFNVRGYSHGVYNRGQDSAGILIYEQSSNNLFYKNSVTHGGDGFFLWAGQTTMDTGQGGSNDNVLLENDFSYAPTNGIEATFSRNKIIRNRMFECDHGIWGGYSFGTLIRDNKFRENRIAIAIEHGQENDILHNLFVKDREAIRLWARKEQPADWVYAQKRDTRSSNYNIVGNSFNNLPLVFNLSRTDSLNIFNNRISFCDVVYKMDSTVQNIDSTGSLDMMEELSSAPEFEIPDVPNPIDPFKGGGKLAGRKNILVNDWGPYNFQYPVVWNTNPTGKSDTLHFDVLGPAGKWKIISMKGVRDVTARAGGFPASFSAIKAKADRTDIEIIAEFNGDSFKDQFGKVHPANKPYRFKFKKFFQPIKFTVNWYAVDSSNALTWSPSKNRGIRPFKTEEKDRIEYAWWGGIKGSDNVQHRMFYTEATGNANLEGGDYELGITWDDAVRVYVDSRLIVDEWNPSKYVFDESPNRKVRLTLAPGVHTFRVEHVELGGFATLSLKLMKK